MMLVAGAGVAAPPPEAAPLPTKDITVTAPDRTMRQAVRDATHAISRPVEGQVARFTEPVCPRVDGLPENYGAIVANRMRRQAEALGAPVAKPDCRPNIIVMMVDNGRTLLQGLEQRAPAVIANIPAAERKRLLADTGPVHVLNLTEIRGSQGERYGANLTMAGGPLGDKPAINIHEASIINMATRQDMTGSLLLIDTPALVGKSLKQIGDYAVMRTLARTDADKGRGPVTSILSLFDGGSATQAPELTSFDQAYIRALYKTPANRTAGAMMGLMTSSINHDQRKQAEEQ